MMNVPILMQKIKDDLTAINRRDDARPETDEADALYEQEIEGLARFAEDALGVTTQQSEAIISLLNASLLRDRYQSGNVESMAVENLEKESGKALAILAKAGTSPEIMQFLQAERSQGLGR